MHIPDGFLSTPVWATLDAAAIPAIGALARRAQQSFDHNKIPLLGVMGAFVFAAQMINFPVAVGTSSHLVGGALLAITLGPWAAAIALIAILGTQALVFQDGGILALGANIFNMAIIGVLAGYVPYYFLGARHRRVAIFAGGFASVLVSAILALSELLISGVKMPGAWLGASGIVFVVSALLEGAITLTVVQSLEALNPAFIKAPEKSGRLPLLALCAAAVVLAGIGFIFTSVAPDGIERLLGPERLKEVAKILYTPLTDYHLAGLKQMWLSQAFAGLIGITIVYVVCLALGRFVAGGRVSASRDR